MINETSTVEFCKKKKNDAVTSTCKVTIFNANFRFCIANQLVTERRIQKVSRQSGFIIESHQCVSDLAKRTFVSTFREYIS